MFLALIVLWYLQDLLQVLFSSAYPVPEIYLMALVSWSLIDERESSSFLWAAFIGGLLFDLRWSGIPGLCASLFSASVTVCRFIWFEIPKEGRLSSLFLAILAVDSVLVSITRALLSGLGKNVALSALGIELLATVPLLLLLCLLFTFVQRNNDV